MSNGKHPEVMLVEIWCNATLYYSSYQSVCLCVRANFQCCVPFIAFHAVGHSHICKAQALTISAAVIQGSSERATVVQAELWHTLSCAACAWVTV